MGKALKWPISIFYACFTSSKNEITVYRVEPSIKKRLRGFNAKDTQPISEIYVILVWGTNERELSHQVWCQQRTFFCLRKENLLHPIMVFNENALPCFEPFIISKFSHMRSCFTFGSAKSCHRTHENHKFMCEKVEGKQNCKLLHKSKRSRGNFFVVFRIPT